MPAVTYKVKYNGPEKVCAGFEKGKLVETHELPVPAEWLVTHYDFEIEVIDHSEEKVAKRATKAEESGRLTKTKDPRPTASDKKS